MIDAVHSLNTLYETEEKIKNKIASLESILTDLNSGKTNLKTLFSFKSKKDDICKAQFEKGQNEKNLIDIGLVIRYATYAIENYMEFFKIEKLANYYSNLKTLALLQNKNSTKINDLWNAVSTDKNIEKLMNSENI
jgi:hypothetical protein